VRFRAVRLALWYGLAPWWWYEDACHYAPDTYAQHASCNLRYAWRWAQGRQTFGDIRHELATNGRVMERIFPLPGRRRFNP
jgi:hypothetical protein